MAINVTNIVFPALIRFNFDADWTWKQLYTATDLAQNSPGIPVVFDLTMSARIPSGGLTHLPEIMKRVHQHAAYVVFITDQNSHTARLLHEMMTMVERVYGMRWQVRYVNHYAEAIEHIELTNPVS